MYAISFKAERKGYSSPWESHHISSQCWMRSHRVQSLLYGFSVLLWSDIFCYILLHLLEWECLLCVFV